MADKLSKIRDFLWAEARRRPHKFLKGPARIPNSSALATVMGVGQPTVWRILNLKRNRPEGAPDDAGFTVTAKLEEGLMRLSGITTRSELWDAIDESNPAPPPGAKLAKPRARPRRRG